MSPNQAAPQRFDGAPEPFLPAAGTRLTRVHSAKFGVTEFNPNVAVRHLRGGRFDATPGDEYSFLYPADDDRTAVSEDGNSLMAPYTPRVP
ncbi:MAG: hypothetical protein OXH95_03865 [bacterium]|nr:hypothetical protein [bacterium]